MGNWKTACLPYSPQRIYVRESGRKLLCEKKGTGRGVCGTGIGNGIRTGIRNGENYGNRKNTIWGDGRWY
jgi:hypothetical protein